MQDRKVISTFALVKGLDLCLNKLMNFDITSTSNAQGRVYVNLMSDAGFKAVYGDKNNKSLLIELLNCFLPEEVRVRDILSYLDREQDPVVDSGKRTYLDLICKGEDGAIFSVEVQRRNEINIFERCMYYGADIYRNQLEENEYYSQLKPLYIIGILGTNLVHEDELLWNTDNLISHYYQVEKRTLEFAPSTIILTFVETARFIKTLSQCESNTDYLLYWFLNGWKYDKSGVPEVFEDIPITEKLSRACEIAAFSPSKRTIYNKFMMTELDIFNQLHYAKEDGFAEGEAKGRAEGEAKGEAKGRAEIALAMLKNHVPIEQVSLYTGMSEIEINKLLNR